MPRHTLLLSGAEVAQEVAEIAPRAVTLYMSGYTDRELTGYDPAKLSTGFLQNPLLSEPCWKNYER
jgi:hypothetical protein